MLAASEPGLIDSLLLLSYPLHRPQRPDELRTGHFPQIHTPLLFVHGTCDGFHR
jgi:predicted alpha/beta-hydrolase family hydrolase